MLRHFRLLSRHFFLEVASPLYDADGNFVATVATSLAVPVGLTIGPDGNLYAVELGGGLGGQDRPQRFQHRAVHAARVPLECLNVQPRWHHVLCHGLGSTQGGDL